MRQGSTPQGGARVGEGSGTAFAWRVKEEAGRFGSLPGVGSGLDVRTDEEPLAAVRRILHGAEEALLGVAFVRRAGVNLLDRQLDGLATCRMVTTTVFGMTTQDGLKAAAHLGVGVRILNDGRGTFHPKVYLARRRDRIAAVVGSANLTSGLLTNVEAVTTLSGPADHPQLHHLWSRAEQWWHSATLDWRPDVVRAPREVLDPGLLERIRAVAAADPVVTTLSERRPNRIVEITDEGVWVQTQRSLARGGPELVDAWMIQVAWDYLTAHGRLTNRHLLAQDGLNVKRSSFVCALLARFPDVVIVGHRPIELALAGSPVMAAEDPASYKSETGGSTEPR